MSGSPEPGRADPRDPARGRSGLDALTFFVADAQTGFGPFVALYLTTSGWTQTDIGQALSLGTLVAMASQLPGGALVDRIADKRWAAAASAVAVAAGAILFAVSPSKPAVLVAEVLHSFASATLGPAMAAVSLALVGRAALGERLGRNARFGALGNGFAAGVLGLCGLVLSNRAVFWVTAAFILPGLFALSRIPRPDGTLDPPTGDVTAPVQRQGLWRDLAGLFGDRRVLAFAGCVALFHLGNAALLPLVSGELAGNAGAWASVVVGACVVVPQALVALVSPAVGRLADARGPRLVVALGFAAVPLRALCLAGVTSPFAIVVVQALDGIGAATFGVMVPLVAADLTRGTNRYNLCLGALGLATAGGATLSTWLGGMVADRHGVPAALLMLAAFGAAAVAAALLSLVGSREPTL